MTICYGKSAGCVVYFWAFLFSLFVVFVSLEAFSQNTISKEYQVKAAFLYHFAKFVEWEEQKVSKFSICLLGDDPFGKSLDAIGKTVVAGKDISVRRNVSITTASECNILFISDSEQKALSSILSAVAGKPILTVSDMSGFLRKGGMIAFVESSGRIKLEINAVLARESGLKINAMLLEIAEKVVR